MFPLCNESMLEMSDYPVFYIYSKYACPLCNESMLEMSDCWKELDKQVAETEMPDEYKNYYVQVLCRDCHKVCVI